MTGYEKLIDVMRKEANRDRQGYPLRLATMTSATTCDYGGVELDEEDLMLPERLEGKLEEEDVVLVAQVANGTFVIIDKVVEM